MVVVVITDFAIMVIFFTFVITSICLLRNNNGAKCIKCLNNYCKRLVMIQGVMISGIGVMYIRFGDDTKFYTWTVLISTMVIASWTILSIIYKIGMGKILREYEIAQMQQQGYNQLPGGVAAPAQDPNPIFTKEAIKARCNRVFCCCFSCCCDRNAMIVRGDNSINAPALGDNQNTDVTGDIADEEVGAHGGIDQNPFQD